VHALGFAGLQHSHAPAADVLRLRLGEQGAALISLLICVSTLGAINGQIFTGARIYYALGQDHPLFGRLGQWNARLGTPVWSLLLQAVATLVPLLIFGRNQDGFQRLIEFNAPAYWLFFLLVGIGVFVLADRDVERSRPFRVPAYPWTPLLFCLMCGWMCYATFSHAYEVTFLRQGDERSLESLWALGIIGAGVLVSFAGRGLASRSHPEA
jgi:amino acid transporter